MKTPGNQILYGYNIVFIHADKRYTPAAITPEVGLTIQGFFFQLAAAHRAVYCLVFKHIIDYQMYSHLHP